MVEVRGAHAEKIGKPSAAKRLSLIPAGFSRARPRVKVAFED